ncbi:type II toxin-antitoxin system PrlF family antitoxin [Alteromonas antoniana]|uniref:type II toxin-antitoxin system PrlF family antitoxin n=1 Tax=Alteromonas antoniana TaxID=2803813 RepID=UPI001C468F63|nr:type II toxin-antitoxin system PrlF family antitoxin [Alteromonas antoniana]
MAQVALEAESTLTDRFQTTVPSPVRQALHLGKKDKIKYVIQSDGSVIISRAHVAQESDPVLGEFLSFIASDMQAHPERLQPLTASMRESVEALVEGVEIDLDAPLMDEDE